MTTRQSTTVQSIMDIVETMSQEDAEDLLSYLEDRDLYTPEVMERLLKAQKEIANCDFVTQEELEAKYGL